MILEYFSRYLKRTKKPATVETLALWLAGKIEKPARSHADKVIQAEIYIAKNKAGEIMLIGKSPTGRNLLQSLYNYVLSCENLEESRMKHFRVEDL